ncbi:MAG: winged helix DNA-binding protein [Proteobacteria bacterium]|nr:winged helix DNA-binding protein [Pseudomonadota bacterium]MBU4120840.1 winged helix DNA-binding protein [Pseudomonadota bacterium]
MSTNLDKSGRELLEIIMGLSREIRCCSRDEAICRDVTFHQFIILDAVAKKGELGLAELHGILSVEKSTTTRLVNPLIQKGLLKRDRATHDSRAARLTLTEEGRETHRRVWLCLAGFFQNITRHIPEAHRKTVLESVRVFTEAMRKAAVACRCCE